MSEDNRFQKFRRTAIAELRPFEEGETLDPSVSVSETERAAGSPKLGDYIGRNPANHDDQWLIAADYFAANFAPADSTEVQRARNHIARIECDLRGAREDLARLELEIAASELA